MTIALRYTAPLKYQNKEASKEASAPLGDYQGGNVGKRATGARASNRSTGMLDDVDVMRYLLYLPGHVQEIKVMPRPSFPTSAGPLGPHREPLN
jgi:hypothetical protein